MANMNHSILKSGIILAAVMLMTMVACDSEAQTRSFSSSSEFSGNTFEHRGRGGYFVSDAYGNRWFVYEGRFTDNVIVTPGAWNRSPTPWANRPQIQPSTPGVQLRWNPNTRRVERR